MDIHIELRNMVITFTLLCLFIFYMKQVEFLKLNTVKKLENSINERLKQIPNSELAAIFTRGGGNVWAVIQFDKEG